MLIKDKKKLIIILLLLFLIAFNIGLIVFHHHDDGSIFHDDCRICIFIIEFSLILFIVSLTTILISGFILGYYFQSQNNVFYKFNLYSYFLRSPPPIKI
jgi:hypothetical protein